MRSLNEINTNLLFDKEIDNNTLIQREKELELLNKRIQDSNHKLDSKNKVIEELRTKIGKKNKEEIE